MEKAVSLAHLSGYLCAMTGLTCVVSLLITAIPKFQPTLVAFQAGMATASLVFGMLAIYFARLPESHAVHRSRLLRGLFLGLAFCVSVFLIVGVLWS